ncbi:MAG: hypothetical protein HY720_26670 [Planctomycetes bacterium]|nr:hypothetical protein [Planctomycetota bacterium]
MKRIAILLALSAMPSLADDTVPGKVVLSNGEVLEGGLRLGRGQEINLFETSQKRRLHLALSGIRRIRFEVESESMENGWMFKEEGSDEKIRLAFQYPVRKLAARIELASGQEVEGHVTGTTLTLETGESSTRFILTSSQKGEKDQTLADLVYVKEVVLADAGAGEPGPSAVVDVTGRAEGVRDIVFIDRDRAARCEAILEGGRYRAERLLPGSFRVFARTEKALLSGMPAAQGNLLSEAERGELQGFVERVEEFFDEKKIRSLAGTKDDLWVLLESRRTRPSHLKDEAGNPILTIRWDLWLVRRGEADWEIRARLFLFRDSVRSGEEFPELELVQRPDLADVWIGDSGDQVIDIDR